MIAEPQAEQMPLDRSAAGGFLLGLNDSGPVHLSCGGVAVMSPELTGAGNDARRRWGRTVVSLRRGGKPAAERFLQPAGANSMLWLH
jgi:hypothetical protein